ncbi:MAG: GGDEF domain-containing protein [Gammaproteobacteria bacterium]|nr:GGDEF domain-containing protein [Gammaproteobacteria bacterium]
MSVINKPSVLAQTNMLFLIAMITLMVMLLFAVINLSQYTQSNSEFVAERTLRVMTLALEEKLSFYQQLVNELAREEQVHGILFAENTQKAQEWALKQRRLIPHAIGLALINEKASVLGDVGELRVGPKCRADLRQAMGSIADYKTKLHAETKVLSHFDIVSVVSDESADRLGLVFASFSVTVLESMLNNLLDENSNVYLLDDNNHPVVQISRVADDDLLRVERYITNTNWKLHLDIKPQPLDKAILGLFIFAVMVSMLFVIVLVVYSKRTMSQMLSEFENIHHVLKAILKHDEKLQPKKTMFRETEQIITDIYSLSGAINYRNQYFSKQLETDPLTGLGNRRYLEERIKQITATPSVQRNYLVFLDLDNFKACNDTYGHEMGDEVLKAFAVCMSRHSRQGDLLIRMGGDEFVALLTNLEEAAVRSWYQRITTCFLQGQSELGISDQACTISAGVIHMQGNDSEQMKLDADAALYKAKHAGRNNIYIAD